MLVNQLPESLAIKFIKFYINFQIKRYAKISVKGFENLSRDYKRPCLFVCNHLSNSDGLILNKVLEKENLIFLSGKKLEFNSMTSLGLKAVKSIPILPNSPDREAIKKVISVVKDGNSVLIFPEGTRSRTAKMLEGKKGILLFAKRTNAPIVPIGIWGSEKFMPVEENMKKESFSSANINVNIGEIFYLPKKKNDETKEDYENSCLNHIMTTIAKLLPKEYQGFYEDKL